MAVSFTLAPIGSQEIDSLGALTTDVISYIQGPSNDPELRSVARNCINLAIDRVNSRNWRWSVTYEDITSVTGEPDYYLPQNFKKPRKLEMYSSTGRINGRLQYLPPKEFLDTAGSDITNGTPHYYTIMSQPKLGTLTFDRSPNSSWTSHHTTIRLWYYSRMPRVAADSDTLDGPPELRRFIYWEACAALARIRGAITASREARRESETSYREITSDDTDEMTDGFI